MNTVARSCGTRRRIHVYGKVPKTPRFRDFFGLGERIRTSGLLNPIQARYQTALHPDIQLYRLGIPVRARITLTTYWIIHRPRGFVKLKFRDWRKRAVKISVNGGMPVCIHSCLPQSGPHSGSEGHRDEPPRPSCRATRFYPLCPLILRYKCPIMISY